MDSAVCDWERVGGNEIIVTDVGQHRCGPLSRSRLRSFIASGGLGTMGYSLRAAIGAAIARPTSVVVFAGDGASI